MQYKKNIQLTVAVIN